MQTLRLLISEWDGWCSWLKTTAEHDVLRSIWAGDRGELSCAHLNGEWQFHAKCHELIGAILACPSDWARGSPLLRDECTVSCCLVARQLYPSCRFSSADCRCFQLSNRCWEIHLVSFQHHTALTDRDLNQNCIFLWNSHDFVYFFTDI